MAGKGTRAVVLGGLAVAAAATAAVVWLTREPEIGCGDLVERLHAFADEQVMPGGVIAVRDGAGEIHEWAFGTARPGQAMTADILFRIASLSKPITARAIRLLADRNRLTLETRITEILSGLNPEGQGWADVTVEHLLNHTGGWDAEADMDPVFEGPRIARALGMDRPPQCPDLVRFMAGRPLQSEPGARYAYSNFGYCLLGLAVEARGGQLYESFVREYVLDGIEARLAGVDWASGDGEASYFTWSRDGERVQVELFFAGRPNFSPISHGPNGGWAMTARGYLDFMAGTDRAWVTGGPRADEGGDNFYGRGWRVWPHEEGPALSHWGRLPGTFSLAVLQPDGAAVVALFNGDPRDPDDAGDRLVRLAVGADLSACPD